MTASTAVTPSGRANTGVQFDQRQILGEGEFGHADGHIAHGGHVDRRPAPAAENQRAPAQRPDQGPNELPIHGQRNEHDVVEHVHPDPAKRQHEHRHEPVSTDRDHELHAGPAISSTRIGVSEMPHGGFKRSGYGRDLSMAALDHFTEPRHVMVRW